MSQFFSFVHCYFNISKPLLLICWFLWLILSVTVCFADQTSLADTAIGFDVQEPLLYPSGCPTADTLRCNEILFAPLGWMSYGVTSDITVMWDWLLGISGALAAYARYRLPGSADSLGLAVEAYGFYLPRTISDQLDHVPNLLVEQRYSQSWLHLNTTWRLAPNWRMHVYAGATYDAYTRYAPEGESNFAEEVYTHTITPDWGLGLEYSATSWLKIHLNYMSGNTLYFYDQIPEKRITAMAFHIAPFPRNWIGILSRMRIELTGYFIHVNPGGLEYICPPIFPIITWQW